ncbi:hypothetical protein LTR37_017740 [Vermiconidia calcicola]|uniref:Uncharacterized protein n=1 Tax=Vermiconidia calcicola TaxID=1690605 RepID=A0ACC3MIZ5_9PEZI|nr:hypothetical protein LTR37_017740 [Vermiconidia calcicola]
MATSERLALPFLSSFASSSKAVITYSRNLSSDDGSKASNSTLTELMAQMEMAGKPILLALPPEIRNQIWRDVVVSNVVLTKNDSRPKLPAVLCTCRQIAEEAMSLYIKESTFTAQITHLDGAWALGIHHSIAKAVGSVIKLPISCDAWVKFMRNNIIFQWAGPPNWTNFLAYLKRYREHPAWGGAGTVTLRDKDRAVFDAARKIVFATKAQPSEKVEEVLEGLHAAIAMRDSAWT